MPTHMQKISTIVEFSLSWHIADLLVRNTFDMVASDYTHTNILNQTDVCMYMLINHMEKTTSYPNSFLRYS